MTNQKKSKPISKKLNTAKKPLVIKKKESSTKSPPGPQSIESSQYRIQQEKIYELLNRLNLPENNLRFWIDGKTFGDIVGLVPVERFYERERGGRFFPFIDKINDNCTKFVIIHVEQKESKIEVDSNYIKIQQEYEKKGIVYIKDFNIEKIYEGIKNIG